jgi:hypothetical protein
MIDPSEGDGLAEQVEALKGLDLATLRTLWRGRWGPAPKLKSCELMAHAIAERLQADAFGDLPPPARRKLAELAKRFAADRAYRPTAGPNLAPGCTLIREWGGARHEVKVLADGFSYLGARFSSLSAVAAHITGVKRSGVLFFGLKEGRS